MKSSYAHGLRARGIDLNSLELKRTLHRRSEMLVVVVEGSFSPEGTCAKEVAAVAFLLEEPAPKRWQL